MKRTWSPWGRISSVGFLIGVTLLLGCPGGDLSGSGSDTEVGDIITFELPPGGDDPAPDLPDVAPDADDDMGCPDDDDDGVCNSDDVCPDGDDTLDDDGDGVPDDCDACADANDNDDDDGDGVADACDLCPIGDDNIDSDEDGTPDDCDCDEAGAVCHEDAYCVPMDAGVDCICLDGYSGDGVTYCDDIDECLDDSCAANAECDNNDGAFTCVCLLGFFGDGYEDGCEECHESCADCINAGSTGCTECAESFWDAHTGFGYDCTACMVCPDDTYERTACTDTADTVCPDCHPDCTYCDGPSSTDCTECRRTQYLNGGTCTDCTVCGEGTYESVPCAPDADVICMDCDVTCETCEDSASTGCTLCASGYYDDLPGDEYDCTVCALACDDGTYESVACADQTNRQCAECDDICVTCTGPDPADCTVCASGYYDDPPGGDHNCTVCALACDDGTYESVPCADQTNRQCASCDDICVTCTGPEPADCTACASGYYDNPPGDDHNCTVCAPACDDGTYESVACADQTNRQCVECDDICATCTGPDPADCTACASGYYDNPPGDDHNCTVCALACDDGTYESVPCADQTNRQCASCDDICATCTGPDPADCTTCASGYYDNPPGDDHDCEECADPCGLGWYESVPCADQTNRVCATCDDICATCTGPEPTDCTACAEGYIDADPGVGVDCVCFGTTFLLTEHNNTNIWEWDPMAATEVVFHSLIGNDVDLNPAEGSTFAWTADHLNDDFYRFVPDTGSGFDAVYSLGSDDRTHYHYPKHIVVYNDEIVVSDRNNGNIWRYTTDGAQIGSVSTGYSNVQGLAVANGFLYATVFNGTSYFLRYDSSFVVQEVIDMPPGVGQMWDFAYNPLSGTFFGLVDADNTSTDDSTDVITEFVMGGATIATYNVGFLADGIGRGGMRGCWPPSPCYNGLDPESDAEWVVCAANDTTAWMSHGQPEGGTFKALDICLSLGYTGVSQWGGTCGDVCGYCQDDATSCASPGTPTFDGNGACPDAPETLCTVVTWECTR